MNVAGGEGARLLVAACQNCKLGGVLFLVNIFEGQCSSGWASLVAQVARNLPAMRETQVRSLGWDASPDN